MLYSHGHAARRANSSCNLRQIAAVGALLLVTVLPANAQGPLVAWGDDTRGLVSGTPAGSFVAVAIGYLDFTLTGVHAVAIRTDGTLVSWGSDLAGQVSGTPAGTFSAVAAGQGHSVALRTDGTLVSWGSDAYGLVSDTPAGTFSAVAAGVYHSVAIRADGTLVSWGAGWDYASGFYSPPPPPPAGTFSSVAAGETNNVAIRTDGTLATWGADPLGNEYTPPVGTFSDVAVLFESMVGIRTDGSLVAWLGCCGGLTTYPGMYADVAAGDYHTLAIRTDGTLVSWGPDSFGVVSGTPAGTFSAVAAGGHTSIAIADSGNEPPVITCNAPAVLWSPDHTLVDVSSAFSIDDPDGDPVGVWIRVFSDETEVPDTGDGTGQHAPDFKTELASGAQGLFLRSERRAQEDGRFYVIVVTADDGNGGLTEAACVAAVCPHDQTQEALSEVLTQADLAAAGVQSLVDTGTLPAPGQAPTGLYEHGLAAPKGPFQ
jgi:hypothetical protein